MRGQAPHPQPGLVDDTGAPSARRWVIAPPGLWQDLVVMTGKQVPDIMRWYSANARDLPWRRPDAGAWAVLVSEIMLQQTPVSRVLLAYHAWLARWPTPPSLAEATVADAVRQWGRL